MKGRPALRESASRNLVCAWSPPDVDKSYHEKSTSSNPPSRSQRQNPDSYCLRVADIQESATDNKTFDRTKKPKKKLSVSERPVDRRPQTYLKDSFVSCFETSVETASMALGFVGPSFYRVW